MFEFFEEEAEEFVEDCAILEDGEGDSEEEGEDVGDAGEVVKEGDDGEVEDG